MSHMAGWPFLPTILKVKKSAKGGQLEGEKPTGPAASDRPRSVSHCQLHLFFAEENETEVTKIKWLLLASQNTNLHARLLHLLAFFVLATNTQDSPWNLTKPRTQNTCLCRGSRFRMSPKPSKLPVDKHKTLMVTPAARSCERVGQKNIAFSDAPIFVVPIFVPKISGVRKNIAPPQASSSG